MKKLGLIGYPLSHSFSKKYFEEKFKRNNISDYCYQLYPLNSISELPKLLEKEENLKGLNVTIPYKEAVIPYLTELDETASAVGAVNCIKISGAATLFTLTGYNTDVWGFKQSIKPFLDARHEKALIIGTGGASKAVEYVLKSIGVECWFLTRDKSKFSKTNVLSYTEVNEYVIRAFKLIINTSPVGMYPNTAACPDLPYHLLGTDHLLYDLVYNPEETCFLKKGKEQGATVINGLGMLYSQADKAWDIWNQD